MSHAGQLGGQLRNAPPTPLPGPSLIDRLVFESPWLLGFALVLAGVVLLVVRVRSRGARLVALGAIVAGAGVIATGTLVTTTRETLIQRARELVRAGASCDYPAFEALLDAQVTLYVPGEALNAQGRGPVRGQVESELGTVDAPGPWFLSKYQVEEVQVALDSDRFARTHVRVYTVTRTFEMPSTSWWRIDWTRQPDGSWLASGIQPLSLSLPGGGSF